jgi:hypothetical protein
MNNGFFKISKQTPTPEMKMTGSVSIDFRK